MRTQGQKLIVILLLFIVATLGFTACSTQKYTVTFECNGGSAVKAITVHNGESVNLPITTKDGFAFAGWFNHIELTGESFTTSYVPTGNVTLYAKFVETDKLLNFSLNDDGQSYTISKFVSSGDTFIEFNVPSYYQEKLVTAIEEMAFFQCAELISITIPNGVMSIGERAFGECRGLKSVVIGSGVTSIGWNAFLGCSRLTQLSVHESNKTFHSMGGCIIETASKKLIVGCSTSIIPIDGSVTSISDLAFHERVGLTSITIPDSVTTIGNKAFDGCSSLTSIVIPDSVTTIGYAAFDGCSGLTSIVIPDSVTTIGSYAFQNCSSLMNVTIGSNVTAIGDWAFAGCKLTSITIPNSVTSIGECAFLLCINLANVQIGDGVTSIGDFAFGGCFNLTSVTIPISVATIGDNAFYMCEKVKEIWCEATSQPSGWYEKWNNGCTAIVHWGGTEK